MATYFVLICPLFVIVIILLVVAYMMRNNNYWKKRGVSYLNPKPLFGNIFSIFIWKSSLHQFLRTIYEENMEPFFGIFFLDQPVLVIKDLTLMKHILVQDFEFFQNRSMGINENHDPIGSKIYFFSQMPYWKKTRKEVSSLYTSSKLKTQFKVLQFNCEQLTDAMKTKITNKGSVFDVKQLTKKYTINVIIAAFFGIKADCFENDQNVFLKVSEGLMNWKAIWHAIQASYMFIMPNYVKSFHISFLDKASTDFFREFTWELINIREKCGRKNNDLIDILLELKHKQNIKNHNTYESDVLAAHVCQVFAAGYESSSTTIALSLFELAKNFKCQKLAREEIVAFLEKYGEITYFNIQYLKYSKNCISETLRKYPTLAFLDRRCTKPYRLPGTNLVLEKGQAVYFSNWGIHNDPRYYPNPSQFDPDRFTEENIRQRPDFSYLPFGHGPRNCSGQRFATLSSVMALANILYNFEIRIPEGGSDTVKFITKGTLLQPVNGIHLEFIQISNNV
ncbi:hypothetical protein HHI36_004622 [Cryptolaemus montrouzieri]|uniref:Cytochrome P450 n=1 Tax=Cryptolaemus montrouzieri TaxID=559131 RepID=A0ABD2NRR0_9CUCU